MINPLISSESHTTISPMACEQVNMKKETDKKKQKKHRNTGKCL